MTRCLQTTCGFIIVLFIIPVISMGQDPADIRDIYQEAKKLRFEQKWTEAISVFDKLLEKYPGSKYEDDAIFWIAYCQEKLPGQGEISFETYSRLVKEYPQSNYADDAQLRQINLAEQLILEGKEEYKDFLHQQLVNHQQELNFQAAIALGRLGDKKALPVLKKMIDYEDYADLARDLITILADKRILSNEETNKTDEPDLLKDKEEEKLKENILSGMLIFDPERYAQYRSMLRKDDEWTKDELLNFAYWHILKKDEFNAYFSLDNVTDKNEWQRKFWKRRDPTPATPENELKTEFLNRIDYARSHFASFWNYLDFKYMPDQHLRLGWPHAPWDARGELYIKYGKPDHRTIGGWHTEIWTYDEYRVDFLVKQYMTDIYGNAIVAGELSYKNYSQTGGAFRNSDQSNPLSSAQRLSETLWNNVNPYVQKNFIFNQEIRYTHQINMNRIKEIRIITDPAADPENGEIVFRYQMAAGELKMVSQGSTREIRYKEIYCILDEDLNEVVKDDHIRRVDSIPDGDYKIEKSIRVNLPKGKYTLHLMIEDQNAENLGMLSYNFNIPNP